MAPAARQQANAPYLVNHLTTGLRLPVLVPPLAPAGQAGPVSLAADDCSQQPTCPPARPAHLRHPPSGTHRRRQGRAQWRPSRKVPAIWRGAQLLAGRVEAENGVAPGPKSTSARLVARGLARWGRCLISPETAQELKTTANDSSRSNEHQTAQCPGLALQG